MKKLLFICLLLVASFTQITARPVVMRIKAGYRFQHHRMRMPSATTISADFEDCVLSVSIQCYSGPVSITILDSCGNTTQNYTGVASGNYRKVIDIGQIDEGSVLYVQIGDTVYEGSI